MSFAKLKKKSKSKTESPEEASIGYHIKPASDLPKFHKAIWQEEFSKVSQLIKKSDVNARDKELRTPLHLAAAKANEPILKLLCHYNPNVNAQDKENKTPLLRASETGSSNAVNILLQAKSDTNISSLEGQTPLHISSQLNDERSVKLLLDHRASINTPNALGLTPLHLAAQAGHANLVALFASEGSDLNALCGESQTPLMAAAEYGRIQVVKSLLELRVDTECKNQRGWKAIDLAQINGHNHCKLIIEDYVKRALPKPPVPVDTQPSLFSDKVPFGVPAVDKNVTQDSELSEEISVRDIHTYSEDDTISYEHSVTELGKRKISLSGALARPMGVSAQVLAPADNTIDSEADGPEIESDSTSGSLAQPASVPQRISPLHSSPTASLGRDSPDIGHVAEQQPQDIQEYSQSSVHGEDRLDEMPVSNIQSSNISQTTVSSQPALIEAPADRSFSDSSDTSISENNLYIPRMSTNIPRAPLGILSPLSDVTLPISQTERQPIALVSQEYRREGKVESLLPTDEATREQAVKPLSPKKSNDVFRYSEKTRQQEQPREPIRSQNPVEPVLEAGTISSITKSEEVINNNNVQTPVVDSSSSEFDSDQDIPIEMSGNPIYDILNSEDSDVAPQEDPLSADHIYDSVYDPLDVSTRQAEPLVTLSSTPHAVSSSEKVAKLPEGTIGALSELAHEFSFPITDNVDPPEQHEAHHIDVSSIATVLKSVSRFESLANLPDYPATSDKSDQKTVTHIESNSKIGPIETVLEASESQLPTPEEIAVDTSVNSPTNFLQSTSRTLPDTPVVTPVLKLDPYLPVSGKSPLQIEESVSEVSSSDEPPIPSRAPPLMHTLSPSRSRSVASFFKAVSTDDSVKNRSISDINELSTSVPLNIIQQSESKYLHTLSQQMGSIQKEKEELEDKLRATETNCSKLAITVEDLKVSCSELQKERTSLVDAQNQAELQIRKLQFEVQQKSSINTQESEMLKQLNEKALKLEFQLIKETESHTNEEVKRKELELQFQLSQTTGAQMSNRIQELDALLYQDRDAISLLKQDYSTAMNHCESLKKDNETLRHEREGLKTEVSMLATSVNTCNLETEKLRTEQSILSDQLRKKESKLETLQQSLYEHNDQANTALQQRLEEIRVLERKSSEDKVALEMQLVSVSSERNQLQANLARANDSINSLDKDIHSLTEKLTQASTEVDHLKQNSDMSQKVSDNVHTAHQTEKELLEREMVHLRDQIKYQQAKIETLEQQMTDKGKELKHIQSILTERGNLITILQRDMDRNSMLLTSTGDKLKLEESNSAKLLKQLEQSAAKIETSKDETSQLKFELDQVRCKLTENQVLSRELESKYQTESLNAQSLISEHRASAQGEKQTLLRDIGVLKERSSLLQEQLVESQNKCEEYHREIVASKNEYSLQMGTQKQVQQACKELQERIKHLEEEYQRAAAESTAQHHTTSRLEVEKNALAEELENKQNAMHELNLKIRDFTNGINVNAQAKESLEIQLRMVDSERLNLKTSLDKQTFYIDSLKDQLTESRRSQTSSDGLYIELTEKKHILEQELVSMREEKNRALMDATEAKLLWETEVKSRSKLGIKLLQFEKDYEETQSLLRLEADTKNKAIDTIKDFERELQHLHEHNSRMEEQNKSISTELKSYKKRIKDFELREHRFPDLKSELGKERTAFENALQSLRTQLADWKESSATLKQENSALKDQQTSAVKEIGGMRSELTRYKSEANEESKSYAHLKSEHDKLQEDLVKWQYQCGQKEKLYLATKEKEMQSRRDFNQKLQELNAHILEQTQHKHVRDLPKREGEIQLIKELEKKTNQLESELSGYGKSSGVGDFLREDSHKRYNSSLSYEDGNSNRNATASSRYRNTKYGLEDSYKFHNKRFSMPQVPATTGDSDLFSHPSYLPGNPKPYTSSMRSSRGSKWLEALDNKIANHLNLGDSTNQDSSSFAPHLPRDPHLTSIFHNYEV